MNHRHGPRTHERHVPFHIPQIPETNNRPVPANHYQPIPYHAQILNPRDSSRESCQIIKSLIENSRESSNERENHQQSNTSSARSGSLNEIFSSRPSQQINFERMIQQFNIPNILKDLANSLLAYSRQETDLKNQMKDLTDIPRRIINDWHEESSNRLKEIRDELLSKLEDIETFKNQDKFSFDEQVHHQEIIAKARKTLDILNGDRQDRLEVYCSLLHAEDINKSLEEKRIYLQKFRETLFDKVDVKPFQIQMDNILYFNEKALNKIGLPEFVDQDKHDRILGGESFLTTRVTERASVYGSTTNHLNISTTFRTARQNQNNP